MAAIVPAELAIKAMMDSGYKNTAYAIAELMDNSIQAGAQFVELLCIEKAVVLNQRTRERVVSIGVLDNGHGMSIQTLSLALQFGNGTRLNETLQTGIGKFGMGLPSASISQAKRVEVWSWQDDIEAANYSYLDVGEIIKGEMSEIPEPVSKKLPPEFLRIGQSFGKQGTLVVWTGLERCLWKTGNAVIKNSEFIIGRMYRKFLNKADVKIRMAVFDGDSSELTLKNEQYAKPNDPLYLMAGTSTPHPYDVTPMFEPWPSKENFETKVEIKYAGKVHDVFIRTSMAKLEARAGDSAGNLPHGQHASKNIGVSILRAGRELELDSSWANWGERRERWWALEVEFPPSLDELFGVTNNKQYASHFAEMAKFDVEEYLKDNKKTLHQAKDEMEEDDDPKLPLIELTSAIRRNIKSMQQIVYAQHKNSRNDKKRRFIGFSPELEATQKTRLRQAQGHVGESDEGEKRSQTEKEEEIRSALVSQGLAPQQAKEFAENAIEKSLKYIFMEGEIDSPAFFSVQPKGGALMLTLNTRHAAYERLVDVLEKESTGESDEDSLQDRLNNALDGLKLLLMAWARYEDEQPSSQAREKAQEARVDWGRMARRFLDREGD